MNPSLDWMYLKEKVMHKLFQIEERPTERLFDLSTILRD
jgi:hypothetical protein